ncbi:MAG: hypothetical protein MJA27_04520 [Pseudanabaenales cyanobacterium]|nr:hypothetical protein [Pseudanabaenales cyanobacterium]
MSEKIEYLQKLELRISEAQAVLTKLKAEKIQVLEQAQHEEIEQLEKHLETAQVRLKDIANVADEAWHEIKEAVEELLKTISESLGRVLGK